MVIHLPAHQSAWRALRPLGVLAAAVVGTVAGTTLLIAGLSNGGSAPMYDEQGQPLTAAEVVMQSSTERALVSPHMGHLASRSTNDKRGM